MEVPYATRRGAPGWLLALGIATAALAGLAMVTVDRPIARALAGDAPSAVWDTGIDALEWLIALPLWRFASTVFLVAGMLACVAWRRRWAPAWMFVAATHLITKLAMAHLKDATGRLRPTEWLAHHQPADTFGWADAVSFPSGHVVLFASLAIPIVALAPRWWPLLVAPAFAMAARMAVGAHFLSDVLGAISLVALIAWLLGLVIRPRGPTLPAP